MKVKMTAMIPMASFIAQLYPLIRNKKARTQRTFLLNEIAISTSAPSQLFHPRLFDIHMSFLQPPLLPQSLE